MKLYAGVISLPRQCDWPYFVLVDSLSYDTDNKFDNKDSLEIPFSSITQCATTNWP